METAKQLDSMAVFTVLVSFPRQLFVSLLATRRSLEGRGSKFDDCQLPIGQDVVKGLPDTRRPTDDDPVDFLAVGHTEQKHLFVARLIAGTGC